MTEIANTETDHKPGFLARWLFSTNHKDIGTLYLILSMLSGVLGTGLSVALRMELQEPGLQFFADPNIYNVGVSCDFPLNLKNRLTIISTRYAGT